MNRSIYGWPELLEDPAVKYPSKDEGPKLSIVIPTLNQASTLEDTILSIINQSYTNFEIILIDGGSTDHTKAIYDKYRDYVTFFESKKDGGQSNAINRGFKFASGDIFAWLNSDDFYLPDAFTKVVKTFEQNYSCDILVGAGDIVSLNCVLLKHINEMDMNYDELLEWANNKWLMQQSCFWRPSIWNKVGGVDESLTLLMDIDLWLRFSRVGKSVSVSDSLAAMRYYPNAKSSSLRNKAKEEMGYIYAKHQELDKVRDLVRELVEKNNQQYHELEKRNKKVLFSFLKRLLS